MTAKHSNLSTADFSPRLSSLCYPAMPPERQSSTEDKLYINRRGAATSRSLHLKANLWAIPLHPRWLKPQSVGDRHASSAPRTETENIQSKNWFLGYEARTTFLSIQITNNFSSKMLRNYKTADELKHQIQWPDDYLQSAIFILRAVSL